MKDQRKKPIVKSNVTSTRKGVHSSTGTRGHARYTQTRSLLPYQRDAKDTMVTTGIKLLSKAGTNPSDRPPGYVSRKFDGLW